ncbi:MAG: septum formation initiator family protein [Clostridia bacterium]|nr:septum formation initiator family protein [Clostridia bacterium]
MRASKNLFIKIAVLIFSVFCFISLLSLKLKNNSLQEQAENLNRQVLEYTDYINELQATLDAPLDDEYVAEIARDKLGLRHPQEVVFYSDDSE